MEIRDHHKVKRTKKVWEAPKLKTLHKEQVTEQISRKEALKKIGNYGKYAALTALGTYLILNPKKAQATSPPDPGVGF